MCHIFFIHSSVDGHLGWFYVLAIVNSAAMNIVVHADTVIFKKLEANNPSEWKWLRRYTGVWVCHVYVTPSLISFITAH